MSYQSGNVAYHQWQPDQHPGRGYSRDNPDSRNNYQNQSTTGQWQNQQTENFHGTRQQSTEPSDHRYREEQRSGNNPRGSDYDYGPNRESSHRYPQTFEADQNQNRGRSTQDQPYGSENLNFNSNRDTSYYSERNSHSRDNWGGNLREGYPPQERTKQLHVHQYKGNYDSSYGRDAQQNPRQNIPAQPRFQENSPDRYGSPEQNRRYGARHDQVESSYAPPDRTRFQQSPRREEMYNDRDNGYSVQNRGFQQYGNRPSYQPERSHDQDNQRNHTPGDYNNHPYSSDMQQSADSPQVVANTGGSSAVFGVVAKNDRPPSHHDDPRQASPTRLRHQPVVPPTKDYLPPFDRYRGNDSSRQQNQHRQQPHSTQQQYRNALTPISEKASPASSIGSKSHSHDNISNMPPQQSPQTLRNQYELTDRNRQPWNNSERNNAINERLPESGGQPYGQPQRSQNQQERSQTHYPRPGYKDFDTSSGYASESTHNTEIVSNEKYQHPNRSQYSPQFPPAPPEVQRQNWASSSTGGYGRSPTRNQESQRHQYDHEHDSHALPQPHFDRGNRDDGVRHYGQDTYGPPVSMKGQYNDKSQHDDRHDSQGYNREQVPYQQDYSKGTRHDPQRSYNATQNAGSNRRFGVEESHVPSVQDARSLFEKRSDPRRPPPAPKPIIAPKPNNVNARPIPPRPSGTPAWSDWDGRDNGNHFQHGHLQGPKSPTSPQDYGRQSYFPNPQPSQSMENLDDRSGHFPPPPSGRPPHAQSLQNLDERSAPMRDTNLPERRRIPSSNQPPPHQENYPRNEYQQTNMSDDRPLVVAVKFNQESGVALLAAKDPPRRHGSWNNSRPGIEPQPRESSYREQRQSWSDNTNFDHRQSYRDNQKQPTYQSNNPEPTADNEDINYVPDVVARSYEMARELQVPRTDNRHANERTAYSGQKAPSRPEYGYNNNGQRLQNFRNMPDQQSADRWPTPPPPISQDQSRAAPRHDNLERMQPRSEDWSRVGSYQQPHSQPNQSYNNNYPPHNESNPQGFAKAEDPVSQQQSHVPQSNYNYDTDSSEIDVDAPTPPPSHNRKPATSFDKPRGHSSYDKNKPIPVHSADQGDSWRIVGEQPPNGNRQRSTNQSHSTSQQYPPRKEQQLSKNPPQKPQRNSTSLSPRLAQASLSENGDFDFDVNVTQPLRNQSSRERARLGKSGALANRKPPSRNGSASNLTEITDEDNFQIEVTDSDLSSTNNKMEVHRMESMRILQNEKGKGDKGVDAVASAANSGKRTRSSHKNVPNPNSEAKSEAKKTESKLYFKKPAGDVAKTIPMPTVTEPANQPTRRPPTYLGFGYTPEKPKTDLLSQFKNARDSAMRTAAEKQDKAMKSVTALVRFNQGKKEVKKQPQPKLTASEKNARVLSKMNIEVSAPPDEYEDERSRNPYHRRRDGHADTGRNSTRSSSTAKPEKYNEDDDTTNGSRHGRGRDRHRGDDKTKSRGRSTSRDRNLSPDRRRGRSSSRGREISPSRRRGRSTSRERQLSPDRRRAHSRHRSKSRERSLSPDDRRRSRPYEDRRYDDRYRRDDGSSYRRSNSPDRSRYDDRRYERMPEHRHYHPDRSAREPDWVEQFRRGRDVGRSSGHQARRAWVNDPRRVEVTVDGRRRELDMDAFEREVKKATSYNSDFEQPSRRQMIPSKLSAKGHPPNSKRKPPPNNWMNDLKERNRMAAKTRYGVYNPPPYQRRAEGDLKYYYKFGRVPRY